MNKGNETKEKIIEEALKLFHARGYYSTSINDIMQSAGIKKGGLYFHIQSKEKLAVNVLEEALSIYEDLITQDLDQLTPVQQIEKRIDVIVSYHVNQGLQKGCIFGNMALEIGKNDSEISQYLQYVFKRWENSFRDMIINAVDKGELKLKEAPEELAKMIFASLEGGIMLSKISGNIDSLRICADSVKKIISDRKTE